jgi:hypothetical protein
LLSLARRTGFEPVIYGLEVQQIAFSLTAVL